MNALRITWLTTSDKLNQDESCSDSLEIHAPTFRKSPYRYQRCESLDFPKGFEGFLFSAVQIARKLHKTPDGGPRMSRLTVCGSDSPIEPVIRSGFDGSLSCAGRRAFAVMMADASAPLLIVLSP
jgi:hypothetical protein